jgi:excisionase family DNA binding protein
MPSPSVPSLCDPANRPLLTRNQVARLTGISRNQVGDAIAEGHLETVRLGRSEYIKRASLRRLSQFLGLEDG